tara:strand:+ start:524 stop:943 length:420 start_codon:yes stop_codon:yes gene_type:complete
METIKTVFNKLNTDKTELGTHKVELALIDDLKRSENSILADVQIVLDVFTKSNKIYFNLESANKEAKERFNVNKQIITSSTKKIDLANKTLEKAKTLAKDLGVNVNQISKYKSIEDAVKVLKDDVKDLIKKNNQLGKLL